MVGSFNFSKASLIVLSGLLLSITSEAQQAKVLKVQGRKAIVQFPDDSKPQAGQMIDLGGGGVSMASGGPGKHGQRAQIIGGSTELSSITPSTSSSSTTSFAFEGRYGINKSQYELGGVGVLTYSSTTGQSDRLLEAGGFFDYNLEQNNPGTEIVYGLGGLAKFGSISQTRSSTETTGTRMTFEGGGQVKWFPLGNTVALRADALLRYVMNSGTAATGVATSSSNTSTGFILKGGLYVYF